MRLQATLLYVTLIVTLVAAACIQSARQGSARSSAMPTHPGAQPSPTATGSAQLTPAPTAPVDPSRRPDPSITSSAVTPDGSLWYAFDQFDDVGGSPPYGQNHGLYRSKDDRVWHFDVPATVRVLKVAPDGSLYVGAGCGVLRYRTEAWETLLSLECDRRDFSKSLFPLDIAFADDGDVWVGSALSLGRFDGEMWTEYDIPALRVALASDGTVWTMGWDGRAGSSCCVTHVSGTRQITYTWTADVPAEPRILEALFDQSHR